MGTLYLDRKDIELRHEGEHLCLYEQGERRSTVPLHIVERVVLRGRATLTTGVLGLLADKGVGLVVLGGRSQRSVAILPGKTHGDCGRRIAQYRWYHEPGARLDWASMLVALKVRAQLRTLRLALEVRLDCRKPLSDAIDSLQRAASGLAVRADQPVSLERLRGIEGAAAAAYFGAYTGLFAPSLQFHHRNRRPPRDPVNSVLSLAYTLVHAEAVQACYAAGLDPYVGFYHEPAHNRESLAADLIEPIRAKVDLWVWRLFAARTLRADAFTQDNGRCLLKKPGREAFYAAYESFMPPVRRLLSRYALVVARRLTQQKSVDGHHAP